MPTDLPTASRDTPKSRRTRARILDAAMRLIAESGYAAASNGVIADAADLTRGAMLYHFPTREDLLDAVIAHIQSQRLSLLAAASAAPVEDADATSHAIAGYWALLKSTPFIAFAELQSVARTDPSVAERLAPAEAEFDRAPMGASFAAQGQAGAHARLQASRDFARFLLEGLAGARLTFDGDERMEAVLGVLQRVVRLLNRRDPDLWPE